MSEDNKLGHYLKAAREEAGLSLGQAANAADTDKGYIARLESGQKSNPSPHVLARLAQAYEISTTDLFLIAGLPIPHEMPSIDALLRADYDLPDEAVAEVRDQIDAIVRRYRAHADDREETT